MVALELCIEGKCIPRQHVLPDVDPKNLTAGALKVLLGRKLCIYSRDMKLLLGGWRPLLDNERVQDLYVQYLNNEQTTSGREVNPRKSATKYYSSVVRSAEVVFDVDTRRLFHQQAPWSAEMELENEEELAGVCVLDTPLELHVKVRLGPPQNACEFGY